MAFLQVSAGEILVETQRAPECKSVSYTTLCANNIINRSAGIPI